MVTKAGPGGPIRSEDIFIPHQDLTASRPRTPRVSKKTKYIIQGILLAITIALPSIITITYILLQLFPN